MRVLGRRDPRHRGATTSRCRNLVLCLAQDPSSSRPHSCPKDFVLSRVDAAVQTETGGLTNRLAGRRGRPSSSFRATYSEWRPRHLPWIEIDRDRSSWAKVGLAGADIEPT